MANLSVVSMGSGPPSLECYVTSCVWRPLARIRDGSPNEQRTCALDNSTGVGERVHVRLSILTWSPLNSSTVSLDLA